MAAAIDPLHKKPKSLFDRPVKPPVQGSADEEETEEDADDAPSGKVVIYREAKTSTSVGDLVPHLSTSSRSIFEELQNYKMYPGPQMLSIERRALLGMNRGQRTLNQKLVLRICELTKHNPTHNLQSDESIIVHKLMYDDVRDLLHSNAMPALHQLLRKYPDV